MVKRQIQRLMKELQEPHALHLSLEEALQKEKESRCGLHSECREALKWRKCHLESLTERLAKTNKTMAVGELKNLLYEPGRKPVNSGAK